MTRSRGRAGSKPSKYRSRRTVLGGQVFDSRLESEVWLWLKAREQKGEVHGLQRQVPFPLEVSGYLVCTFVADFVYFETASEERVVADAKGFRTPVYKLKRKLFRACYGADILELPERAKAPRSTRSGRQTKSSRKGK